MTYVLLVLISILTFAIGYALGTRSGPQSELTFSDPGVAEEMGIKGLAAVESRITRRKERIMTRARKHKKITNDDVEDLFCISDATARKYLNELVDTGKLKRVGTGSKTHYIPT